MDDNDNDYELDAEEENDDDIEEEEEEGKINAWALGRVFVTLLSKNETMLNWVFLFFLGCLEETSARGTKRKHEGDEDDNDG